MKLYLIALTMTIFLAGCSATQPASNLNESSINSSDNTEVVISEGQTSVEQALLQAIDDEYKARTLYEQVLSDYGNVRPFSNIINAEENHVQALVVLLEQYNIAVPENPYVEADLLIGYNSIQELCSAGVEAEIANVALYREKLLPSVTEYPDVTATFTRLMDASESKHLPAFQRCE